MGDDTTQNPTSPKRDDPPAATTGGGGWGGWGIPSFAVLSDLQKAAEEISKNAVAAAKTVAKGITDLETVPSDTESEDEASKEVATKDKIEEDESDNIRKSALDKLEKASEESLLGQGLKAFDTSVETFTAGAWNVFGSAWKGGSDIVQNGYAIRGALKQRFTFGVPLCLSPVDVKQ